MLFDGFGSNSDDFGEFSGRIVGMIFEQLEDFLPTFLLFLTTFDVGITGMPDTLYKSFNLLNILQKVRDFRYLVYSRGFLKGSPLFLLSFLYKSPLHHRFPLASGHRRALEVMRT